VEREKEWQSQMTDKYEAQVVKRQREANRNILGSERWPKFWFGFINVSGKLKTT
jgi:hypothetical protein